MVRWVAAIAAALLAIGATVPAAGAVPDSAQGQEVGILVSNPPQDVPDGMWYDPATGRLRADALEVDAAGFAKRTGLPAGAVLAALRAQLRMDELLPVVESRFPDTFVGLYWNDEMQAIAQFKGHVSAEALRILRASGVGVRAELVKYSASELDAVKNRVVAALKSSGLEEWIVAIDQASQVVLVTVGKDPAADSTATAEALREAFESAPVEIDTIDGPVAIEWGTYGGGAVGTLGIGYTCTAGFTVQSGSTNGVATAGHCGAGLNSYLDPFPNPDVFHTMTYQIGSVGYWGDFEWFTTNGTEFDDFYLPNGSRRDVSGVKNTFAKGDTLYWWGWGTYPTPWIDTVEYPNVTTGGAGHLACTKTLGGNYGDSGGPVYFGNTAAGFVFGAAVIDGLWRACHSQARYIDDAIGVSIKTS